MRIIDLLRSDTRAALRSLMKRRGFAAASVATLALGIGASTTVFSIVDTVLLEPLPYPASERIGILWHDLGHGAQSLPVLNPLDFRDYQDRNQSFEEMTIGIGAERILAGNDRSISLDVGLVGWNFLHFFDGEALLGRFFERSEEVRGAPKVAVLSHELWQARFGGDSSVLGRTIELDGVGHEVIGVTSAEFRLHLPAEAFLLRHSQVWVPVQIDWNALPPRNVTSYTAFARLRPNVGFDEAQQELDVLADQLRTEHAVHAQIDLRARVVPLHGDVVKRARRGLSLLMAAVGIVALVACANVSLLMLVHGRSRERELALRLAVGAGRGALVRVVFVESLLLAIAGAAAGILVAHAAIAAIVRFASTAVPRMESTGIDGSALVFAMTACVLSALAFGLLPALRASRTDVAEVLARRARTGERRGPFGVRGGLIAVQLASALVLSVNAGLLLRSFVAMQGLRPGFDPRGAVTMRVSLPPESYGRSEVQQAWFSRLRSRLRGLPSVTDVGTVNQLPLTGIGGLQPFAYDAATARHWEDLTADRRFVDEGFFDAIGARLLAGRWFRSDEVMHRRRVIVIDDRLADLAFPGIDPVGRRLQIAPNDSESRFAEIVGVLEHLNLHDVTSPGLPQIFRPGGGRRRAVVVRTTSDPAPLAAAIRRELMNLDPRVAMSEPVPVSRLIDDATASARLRVALMAAFGIAALGLAAVGVYGVTAYSITERNRELGIRLALGATPLSLQSLVSVEGSRSIWLGLTMGLIAAPGLASAFSSLLYGVEPWDPASYATAAVVLAVVASIATWVPARRASRVDPLVALRQE